MSRSLIRIRSIIPVFFFSIISQLGRAFNIILIKTIENNYNCYNYFETINCSKNIYDNVILAIS